MVENFSNLDLETADFDQIYSLLDERGKTEFNQLFVNFSPSGNRDVIINEILEKFHPWWVQNPSKNIQYLDENTDSVSQNKNPNLFELEEYDEDNQANKTTVCEARPPIYINIPEFETISKLNPSPLVFNQLIGILYY
ncbi:hypothetical protein AYI68_g4112 [Smittium mucronatum]|uniref:Uncharacterized protein n=1 Tax=Smittium mucronatum TaxID=133383 RepID=A0A1R0GY02_9FUNG|nr:hypothetical protein AYI68_g4112 [Smittium mucronatum]